MITIAIINGKEVSGGAGGVSDADLSAFAVDFLSPGAVGTDHFKVTPPSGTSRSVVVKAGIYYARNAAGTMVYRVTLDADQTVSLTTNVNANPRKDAIVLRVDLGTDPNSTASNVGTLVAVVGTPNVSPVAPTGAAIQTSVGSGNVGIRLGEVECTSNYTTITSTNITDTRTVAGLMGNAIPDGLVTQAKAPFAMAGPVANAKMVSVSGSPSYNGLAAGAAANESITFPGLSSVSACFVTFQRGAGGSNERRMTWSLETQLPSVGNTVQFNVFNGSASAAFISNVTYMAIGT